MSTEINDLKTNNVQILHEGLIEEFKKKNDDLVARIHGLEV